MIISDNKKFIYTHIQKTGGSTIENTLRPYFDHEDILYKRAKKIDKQQNLNLFNPKSKLRRHLKHRQIIIVDPLYVNLLNEYFVFTFVRNPYDLIYSRFLQNFHKGRLRKHSKRRFHGMKIDKFNTFFIHSGTRLQFDFIIPRYIDFIGHTERLSDDFRHICHVLNLGKIDLKSVNIRNKPKPACDPHNMKWDDYKYLDKYERRTIKLVNKHYARDFDYFGYQKLDPKDFPTKVDKSDDSNYVRSLFKKLQRFSTFSHPLK